MGAIQPPFTLYTLRVEPGTRNSPPLPAVHLLQESEGQVVQAHTLTPEQAREMAADLIAAAEAATPRHIVTDSDTHEPLTPPMPLGEVRALVAATIGRRVHAQAVTA